ncbi:MAG: class I SAM-dependent methyltransferase [Betaproteobacteria bacterium]|nr:class I SAM-dependent methyltransferase [Betaproteobacteria bacterium]
MSEKSSLWVERFLPYIKSGGDVLDLACGRGRHSLLLHAAGYRVEAVDRDVDALAEISGAAPGIRTHAADLEGDAWPYRGRKFDGIVVTNYLFRPLFPHLLDALAVDGVLIYETFMAGNERFGKPSNPAFLLRPGELLDVVRGRLTVVAFEQGEVATPRSAMVQRLCATKRTGLMLPG